MHELDSLLIDASSILSFPPCPSSSARRSHVSAHAELKLLCPVYSTTHSQTARLGLVLSKTAHCYSMRFFPVLKLATTACLGCNFFFNLKNGILFSSVIILFTDRLTYFLYGFLVFISPLLRLIITSKFLTKSRSKMN